MSDPMHSTFDNPLGLRGIDFVEYAHPQPDALADLFSGLGFSRRHTLAGRGIDVWTQRDVTFLVNHETDAFAGRFVAAHGPCISAMGWRVDNAEAAFAEALVRGAVAYEGEDGATPIAAPAIRGIGGSLIVFVDGWEGHPSPTGRNWRAEVRPHAEPMLVQDRGFYAIDHLTNNVQKGQMETWRAFYRDVFGFRDVRTFDIRGEKTGLSSYALRSPDGSFCIPINEGSEDKSQIEEYLREYNGAGVQHIALLTDDLLGSLDRMVGSGIATLDIDPSYYREVFDRVHGVREDPTRIEAHQVLVDGDDDGYLLQIFTQNVIGPIFFELIQRRNHDSFGEGNFGALFRSIERDQERRGVL
ncbi:MAG: 4-hydroxyphenylpyruvate dioxygenase [Pseudomonadota bacterium]